MAGVDCALVTAEGHELSAVDEIDVLIASAPCVIIGAANDLLTCDLKVLERSDRARHHNDREIAETKTGTYRLRSAATCNSVEVYDYYVSSWSNSSVFSGTKYSPDYYGSSYDSSNHVGYSADSTVSATCTTQGYTVYKCVCGDTYKSDYTNALGHSDINGGTANVHTKCSVCGVTTSSTHYYSDNVTAPTCTAQGYTTKQCTCGYSYKTNYTSATGHSYNIVNTTRTWSSDHTSCTGRNKCLNCSYVFEETASATRRDSGVTPTCQTQEKWDYVVSFSNSSILGGSSCPDYHYGDYDYSNHTGPYSYGSWYSNGPGTTHSRSKTCTGCGLSAGTESALCVWSTGYQGSGFEDGHYTYNYCATCGWSEDPWGGSGYESHVYNGSSTCTRCGESCSHPISNCTFVNYGAGYHGATCNKCGETYVHYHYTGNSSYTRSCPYCNGKG